MRRLTIGDTLIDDNSECYVIAEIGHNHQGRLETCREMFKVAKECGANAVKLQKRDNRTLYTQEMYDKPYSHENSFGATYGEHREALEFGWDEYRELKAYADELGIHMFATAFDFVSAEFLAKLEVPAYKIASGDLKNIPLLKHVAQFQKPVILSTGGGNMEDVIRAYDAIMPINTRLCILQCTAGYPAAFEELNLRVVSTFRERFPNTVIGLSSHDNGIAMATAAYVLGARVVEKHFTLNHTWKGTDHAFSLEPPGFGKLVRDLRRVRVALGDGIKRIHLSEQAPMVKMGKRLVVAHDLPAGHALRREDIAIKSPGGGVQPYEMDKMVGRVLLEDLATDADVRFEVLSGAQSWREAG
jgi:N-acetylneuraminate synthase/sialic acid synthase